MSREESLRAAVESLLRAAGLDPAGDPDLGDTPRRVARQWETEFLAGYGMDPAAILGDPVLGEADPDVVVVGGLRFHAMCPHHLLPYRGVAHVAYLPNGKLVGFGRLAELVDCFTKRLTLQERATHQIAEALCRHLGARGAGCVIEAEQLCLALPGEKHDQSGVVTSAFVGEMRERPDIKARLLDAAKLGGAFGVSGAVDAKTALVVGALDGKTAVVTGASRGIGRAIATALAGAGARVAGCARHAADGVLACDVGRPEDVARFAEEVTRRFGPPDVLVNNAGIVARGRLEEMPIDSWDAVLDANLRGTFLVTRAFLPGMRARRGGRIVNIASISGRQGTAELTAYCAAKHGVVGLTRALAEEVRGDRIAVNAVCPGSVDTDMLRVGRPGARPDMSPEEVAGVVLYLAAAAPAALTGSCVDLFG